jgi:dTDP-L-rhamnose 4-epimerase
MRRILITGGAGFIGSHLATELLIKGYQVRALDSLIPQVHGPSRKRPVYLNNDVELQVGDIRNPAAVNRALRGVDAVCHLVARVGVGQSMYEVQEYTSVNNVGTAVLMEALIKKPIERLMVASSMSIYGEGAYVDREGKPTIPVERNRLQLRTGDWEMHDAKGELLSPVPTREDKSPALASVYALSKFDQERMCLLLGNVYQIPTVALRFFNIYGPYQSLSNPYTGVLAIFASRLINGNPPLINEDGLQQRDFINVKDVARACRLALEADGIEGESFNIASGQKITILDLARQFASAIGKRHIEPEITGKYRVGDIRHCYADASKARDRIGFRSQVRLAQGMQELIEWLDSQTADDRAHEARAELVAKGLML